MTHAAMIDSIMKGLLSHCVAKVALAYRERQENQQENHRDSNIIMVQLNNNEVRKVYLLTYSQADTDRFNHESYTKRVTTAFQVVTRALIIQWACCMEHHMDAGVHFHMCVLLSKLQRWKKVKKYVQEHGNIVINISGHSGYHTAYQYVTKQDTQVLRNENHPAALAVPKTSSAIRNHSSHKKGEGAQKKWLINVEVSKIIVSHSIDSTLHLLALAKKRKTNGDSRLYEFVLTRGEKRVNGLIQSVWSMERAQQMLDRRSMSCTDLLKKASGAMAFSEAYLLMPLLHYSPWVAGWAIIYTVRVQRTVAKHSFLAPY